MLSFFYLLASIVAISQYVSASKSSYRYVDTTRGPRTITVVEKSIQASQSRVHSTICDYSKWPEWISPASSFRRVSGPLDEPRVDLGLSRFKAAGDACDEIFGWQGSSRIRWKVREIDQEALLTVYSSESEGTFGWDELEMSFALQAESVDRTKLAFTYSWTVPNPIVSVIEKLIIRQSMINDNEEALNKLAMLCEARSS